MSKIIRTVEGCYSAYPGQAVDEEALRSTCIANVSAGRGHFAAHVDGMPSWLAGPLDIFLTSPAITSAALGCVVIWLLLLVRIVKAKNLRTSQKWGWAVGLTALFPVFSVLYFALAPVAPKPTAS